MALNSSFAISRTTAAATPRSSLRRSQPQRGAALFPYLPHAVTAAWLIIGGSCLWLGAA